MANEKLKLTARLKIKSWPNQNPKHMYLNS
jgi:hypothetical protein